MSEVEKASVADKISITELSVDVESENLFGLLVEKQGAIKFNDAYKLFVHQGEAWLFDYGVLVCWNVAEADRLKLCTAIFNSLSIEKNFQVIERYTYSIDETAPFSVRSDHLVLPDHNHLTRLSLSHAFAQSVKLVFFEDKIVNLIQENRYISKVLAETGKIPLSRRKIARLRGRLFDAASDVTVHYGLLDTPEFFWNYPELEGYYLSLSRYLDLSARTQILEKKISVIHELLAMLADEQNHKHSSFLEWIIILLIAVDIAIYFV